MTKAERMKERWKDPEFRKRQKESLKTRRPRGSVKAEKDEKARRRDLVNEERDIKKEEKVEKVRKKEVIQEYLDSNKKEKEAVNTEWMTCLGCLRILPASRIIDKRLNLCFECK